MNTNAKVSKTTLAGVVGLTAASIAATIVLANDTAAGTSDFRPVEEQQSAPTYNYTGPRTADAVEGWLKSKTAHIGPRTADAAEAWIESSHEYLAPKVEQPAFCTDTSLLPRTADAAEAWLRACPDADVRPTRPRTPDDGGNDRVPRNADAAEAWLR
ncbi:MAG: hypothetical protein ACREUZ_13235 [Burkholderiales bacterium]